MVIRRDNMELQKRENMRGGDGIIEILHLDKKENMTNCRLFSHSIKNVGSTPLSMMAVIITH
jgi:hypothetical protein